MRYLISNLPLALGEERLQLAGPLAHHLGGRAEEFANVVLERRSLDARHKGAIRFLATLSFETLRDLAQVQLPPGCKLDQAHVPAPYEVAPVTRQPRVVVVGSGPAGTFCALRLLDYGIEPIVLERGPAMSERVQAINALWKDARLNPNGFSRR